MGNCSFIISPRSYRLNDGRTAEFKQRFVSPDSDLSAVAELLSEPKANAEMCGLAHRICVSDPDANETAVYVIGPEDYGVCKLGISNNPKARLAQLQIAHWTELKIFALAWVRLSQAVKIEKLAHRAAREMNAELRGEWLDMEPIEATQLIVKAARYDGILFADSLSALANMTGRVGEIYQDRRKQREAVPNIPA